MSLYHILNNNLVLLDKTQFESESLLERRDLQQLIKNNISALGKDLLILAEEYGEFEDSRRRIDLLAVDKQANLVVIELKRTNDGGHMELQAIRYAAMISNMTWSNAINAFENYASNQLDAEQELLKFLEWDEPRHDEFGLNVRIILASGDFSKEITTSVIWLNQAGLDITCVRLNLHKLNNELLLNSEQIIPLAEAKSYQIELREKQRDVREAKLIEKDYSTYSLYVGGNLYSGNFKKSDIAFTIVKALEKNLLIDKECFEFLRNDYSCSFQLLKKKDEMTENEKKYKRYRFTQEPELVFEDCAYYVARNWGRENIQSLIDATQERFPSLEIKKDNM